MTGGWGSVLTGLISLALVIALSPLTIIPAVLALHTPRPKAAGLAYTGGWLIGIAVIAAVFVEVSGVVGGLDKPPTWASWARVVIAAALIVFGLVRWFTRHRSSHMPGWTRQISGAAPAKAGVIALLLAFGNPKVLFVSAAAGVAIGTAGLGAGRASLAVLYFDLIAGSTVALPALAYAMSGDRLEGPLSRLKDWMERHNAALMAVILVVIGLLVLYKGIHAL